MFELRVGALFISSALLLWVAWSGRKQSRFILIGALLLGLQGGGLLWKGRPNLSKLPLKVIPQAQSALADVSLQAWRNADAEARLATGIYLLQVFRQEQIFKEKIRSQQDYQRWSLALQACLTAQDVSSDPVRTLARRCVGEGKLKLYLP